MAPPGLHLSKTGPRLMSEPTSTIPTALEWQPHPRPVVWITRPPRTRWWLYVLFLLLTFFSTTVVGARMEANFLRHLPVFSLNDDTLSLFPITWIAQHPANLLMGLPFSLTLMFILFAHEMGHYLYARHYHVYATPPFFVPFPSLIGTLGAFIRIKSPIPSRAALFDIGIAGRSPALSPPARRCWSASGCRIQSSASLVRNPARLSAIIFSCRHDYCTSQCQFPRFRSIQ